jgi:hypothetical protein
MSIKPRGAIMAEWFYLAKDQEKGPFSGSQLREFADLGYVLPSTPVRKRQGDETSPWTRAGAIQGMFAGDVTQQLGDPICDDCGTRIDNGSCPKCTPVFVKPKPQPASQGEVVLMRGTSGLDIEDVLIFLGIILVLASIFSLAVGIGNEYGWRFKDDNAVGATANAIESIHTKVSTWSKFTAGLLCFALAMLRRIANRKP